MQRRSTWRARDARATPPGAGACRDVRGGFTLIELLVAMMLFAVMVGSALAALPRRPYAVWNAQADVIAELRRTRNDALTRGDHFRMIVTGASTWQTQRLSLVAGAWVADPTPVRTGTLPNGVEFTTGVGKQFEFTTRGLMMTPGAATTLVVQDTETFSGRGVTVYPSGQVAPA